MSAPFQSLLERLEAGGDLTEAQAESLISEIMGGRVAPEEIGRALLALRAKGESLGEVVGAARAMRKRAVPVRLPAGAAAVDTCGTGGDRLHLVNISTLAALVAAGAGVTVAKHGNRSVTSASGSADLLEALGVRIDAESEVAQRCLAEAGFAFLFAPRFHPAMKAVAPVRKALKVPTLFNLLGPLTNPAGVRRQVVGVADASKTELYARALLRLGAERALVVRGAAGEDELSTAGPTEVIEIDARKDPGGFARYTLEPETFGISRSCLDRLKGGAPEENACIAQAVLRGEPGPVREAVLFNAAAALYAAGAAGDIATGLQLAARSVDAGKALEVLGKLRRLTREIP